MAENTKYVGHIGRIDPYDPDLEIWDNYAERLDNYFDINEISNDKRVAALLSLIGPNTYKLLKNLIAPEKPKDKTYTELVDALKQHHTPKPLKTAERHRFHRRFQQENESIADFVAGLKQLSINCGYSADTLKENLKDRFIVGLKNTKIQEKLISRDDYDFHKCVELATTYELASQETQLLGNTKNSINYLGEKTKTRSQPTRRSGAHGVQPNPSNTGCHRCLSVRHTPDKCPCKDLQCKRCLRFGHIGKACRTKDAYEGAGARQRTSTWTPRRRHKPANKRGGQRRNKSGAVHQIEESDESSESSDNFHLDLHSVNGKTQENDKIMITCKLNGKPVEFELDTGSALSIIPQDVYERQFSDVALKKTSTVLKTYTGQMIKPIGALRTTVKYKGQKNKLVAQVVPNGANPLMGRDWIRVIKLDWQEIKAIHIANSIESDAQQQMPRAGTKISVSSDGSVTHPDTRIKDILNKHKPVFKPGIGLMTNVSAKFKLKADAQPKFVKARSVPYSLKPKVEEELNRLESEGIISPVNFSEWASPIVVVPKKNNAVRLCGDFKTTLNPALCAEQYPLPKIEDIFASLAGGQKFSKIDLRQAFLSMPVAEEHRKYVTISTEKGLYQMNRLPYGTTDSSAKWQKAIDQILNGVPGTKCIIDDIIITGSSDNDHLKNLDTVLTRLEVNGLKANPEKCVFFAPEIEFCGHKISARGLHKDEKKIKAVVDAPPPTNVKELRSFLGLVNYYHKFIPQVADKLTPLYELTEKNSKWSWKPKHEEAFKLAKKEIASERVLTHYDNNLPIHVQTDASPKGISAVLSHIIDKTERPVMFISRSLRPAERNYPQIQKEALAIYWGCKRFLPYLYGRHFTLVTDSKPLTQIFNPSKGLPNMSAMRLQNYAVFLSGLNYSIKYRTTSENGNCDCLSRLPLPTKTTSVKTDAADEFEINQLESIPVNANDVKKHTQKDPVLSRVYSFIQSGRWDKQTSEYEPYYNRKTELSTQSGIIFWKNRVVIPPKLRDTMMTELHDCHPGIVRMKSIARSYFWFPGLDKQIESIAQSCAQCIHKRKSPPESQLHSWRYPDYPFQRIQIDFAGPMDSKMFLVIIDCYSKWPEVEIMKTTSSEAIIEKLRTYFARFGLPSMLVSDNAAYFRSKLIEDYFARNGIKHISGAPGNPRTQGNVENFIGTFKRAMKTMSETKELRHKIDKFLFRYRTTEHATTGQTPCVLAMKRAIRTRLDIIKPSLREHVTENQAKSKKNLKKLRQFDIDDNVLVKDFRLHRNANFTPAVIIAKTGPKSYKVKTNEGSIWARHIDQILSSDKINVEAPTPFIPTEELPTELPTEQAENNVRNDVGNNFDSNVENPNNEIEVPQEQIQMPNRPIEQPKLRRSTRTPKIRQLPNTIPWDSIRK